ncbi:MAG: AI-2E family transporter [Bacteroidetes bacterium]|nr:AI-2E family transporter [Bacteroidota bacterium]
MMVPPNREIVRGLSVVLGFLAAVFLILGLLSKIYPVLIYFGIAVVLSVLGKPAVDFICSRHIGRWALPRWIGALMTLGGFYLLIGGAIAALIPLIYNQAQGLLSLSPDEIVTSLQEPISRFEFYLRPYGIPQGFVVQSLEDIYNNLFSAVSLSALFAGTFQVLSNLGVAFFTITFSTFFLLKEKSLFFRAIISATPDEHIDRVKRVSNSSRLLLRRYIVGLVGQLSIFAIVVSIGLTLFGIKYAILIAIIGGFMNIIPYLGPLLGGSIGVILALTTYPQDGTYDQILPLILKVVGVFWLAQIIDNNLVGPTIFAKVVKAHPLEIFMVVLSAGMLAGIPGMIVAIPVYTVLRIIGREFFSEFKWVNALTSNLRNEP